MLIIRGSAAARVCTDSFHSVSFSVKAGLCGDVCYLYVAGVCTQVHIQVRSDVSVSVFPYIFGINLKADFQPLKGPGIELQLVEKGKDLALQPRSPGRYYCCSAKAQ